MGRRRRIRQHVNPLAAKYVAVRARAIEVPAHLGPTAPCDVELGCADAQFTLELARRHPERVVVGLDIRERIVEFARRDAEAAGLANVRLAYCNMNVDLDRVLGFWSRDDLDGAASYLADGVARVASAGASVAGIAANTPHIVFDRVLARSPIPLVSIVEATCTHAQGRGCRRVGLLGTETTMKGRFYPEVFDRQGIEVVAPPDTDQPMVHHIYVDELVKGIFKGESRTRLESLISRWSRTEHLDAVILGGTELPLILREPQVDGVPLIDTTAVHVEALIAAAA